VSVNSIYGKRGKWGGLGTNINFATPTHVVSQILGALLIAVEKGLCIPLVYVIL